MIQGDAEAIAAEVERHGDPSPVPGEGSKVVVDTISHRMSM